MPNTYIHKQNLYETNKTRSIETVKTSAKARLTSATIWWKFNHLFIGPLPTFPENVMQIRLEVFVQSW